MRFRGTLGAMWKPILGYGVLLALGTLGRIIPLNSSASPLRFPG